VAKALAAATSRIICGDEDLITSAVTSGPIAVLANAISSLTNNSVCVGVEELIPMNTGRSNRREVHVVECGLKRPRDARAATSSSATSSSATISSATGA
jgi:hypothetical protein